jgi:hypothetical protein
MHASPESGERNQAESFEKIIDARIKHLKFVVILVFDEIY